MFLGGRKEGKGEEGDSLPQPMLQSKSKTLKISNFSSFSDGVIIDSFVRIKVNAEIFFPLTLSCCDCF